MPDIPKMGMMVKRKHSQKGQSGNSINRANSPVMGNELKRLRNLRGWTVEKAAAEMGLSYGGYMKLERGERRLKSDQIAKAAEVYNTKFSDIAGAQVKVYVVGEVIQGGIVRLYDASTTELELVHAPDDATSGTVAYRVPEGSVLSSIHQGSWIIFHDEPVSEVPDEWIGKLCVCVRADNTTVVRRIHYGKTAGTFDLIGGIADAERGQSLKSIAIVTYTKQT